MRQSLVNSRLVGPDKKKTLSDIMTTAMADLINQMKSVLQNLKVFSIFIAVLTRCFPICTYLVTLNLLRLPLLDFRFLQCIYYIYTMNVSIEYDG